MKGLYESDRKKLIRFERACRTFLVQSFESNRQFLQEIKYLSQNQEDLNFYPVFIYRDLIVNHKPLDRDFLVQIAKRSIDQIARMKNEAPYLFRNLNQNYNYVTYPTLLGSLEDYDLSIPFFILYPNEKKVIRIKNSDEFYRLKSIVEEIKKSYQASLCKVHYE